jgi:hypothetical protein
MRALALAALGFLAASCVHRPDSPAHGPLCADQGFAVFTGFAGAGQHGCALTREGPVLTVWPEVAIAGPINPSPWYAFEVEVREPGLIRFGLDYGAYEHRYHPWATRDDGGTWFPLPAEAVEEVDEGRLAFISLDAAAGRIRIAAQPIRTPGQVAAWSAQLAERHGLKQLDYGRSPQGRPLTALMAGPSTASRLIVMLTGQHPPEYPGARSFEIAAETLLAEVPGDIRVLLIPLFNPDGAVAGHWRHTAAGIDSNRDWFDATLPEIEAAQTLIKSESMGREIVAFLDFHSTRRTLVYAPSSGEPGVQMGFAQDLRSALNQTIEPDPDWIENHNAGQGTSKSWALERLGVAALTIEVGDNASEYEITEVGKVVARTLLAILAEDRPR